MKRSALVLLVAGMSLAAACGSDDAGSTPADTAALGDACISADQGESADGYVGLDEAAAEEQAVSDGLTLRVAGVDGECLPLTMDLRDDRVNVELVDGVVVTAVMF